MNDNRYIICQQLQSNSLASSGANKCQPSRSSSPQQQKHLYYAPLERESQQASVNELQRQVLASQPESPPSSIVSSPYSPESQSQSQPQSCQHQANNQQAYQHIQHQLSHQQDSDSSMQYVSQDEFDEAQQLVDCKRELASRILFGGNDATRRIAAQLTASPPLACQLSNATPAAEIASLRSRGASFSAGQAGGSVSGGGLNNTYATPTRLFLDRTRAHRLHVASQSQLHQHQHQQPQHHQHQHQHQHQQQQQQQNQHHHQLSDGTSFGINLEQYISKRNERERSRVRFVNDAFHSLQSILPADIGKQSKRMSKVEILRSAMSYIKELEAMLHERAAAAATPASAASSLNGSPVAQQPQSRPASNGHDTQHATMASPQPLQSYLTNINTNTSGNANLLHHSMFHNMLNTSEQQHLSASPCSGVGKLHTQSADDFQMYANSNDAYQDQLQNQHQHQNQHHLSFNPLSFSHSKSYPHHHNLHDHDHLDHHSHSLHNHNHNHNYHNQHQQLTTTNNNREQQ